MSLSAETTTYVAYREDWLARHVEEVIEPDLPIVDAHHHLWDLPRPRYMADELVRDLNDGHAIVATVYVDCRSFYRDTGPRHLRPVGEVEFANGAAAMGASGHYGATRFCAAIVGHVDLRWPEVEEALAALAEASPGRLRGIRQVSAWDASPDVIVPSAAKPRDLLRDPAFRRGFAALGRRGLSFDAFMYHHQLGDLLDLALAFPETPIIIDHCGGALGIGPYAGRRDAVFAEWRDAMRRLAACSNVLVKIGGLGMRMFGFGFDARERPASSEEIAAAWRPYVEQGIALFGVERAMFESNFPPDKGSCSYRTLWNAFKRLCAGASEGEKQALFSGTASRVYRL